MFSGATSWLIVHTIEFMGNSVKVAWSWLIAVAKWWIHVHVIHIVLGSSVHEYFKFSKEKILYLQLKNGSEVEHEFVQGLQWDAFHMCPFPFQ